MNNQMMTKAQQVYFVVFAILSVPSAYMFGLSRPLGSGVSALLDSNFFAGELFRFGLLVVVFTALGRLAYMFLKGAINFSDKIQDAALVVRFPLLIIKFLAPLSFVYLLVEAFISPSLLPVFLALLVSVVFVSCVSFFLIELNGLQESLHEVWGHRYLWSSTKKYSLQSIILKSYWKNPALLIINFSAALIIVSFFGTYRMITIALGPHYCVVTEMGELSASIVGMTEDGIVVSTLSADSRGIFLGKDDVRPTIHFVDKNRVLSVHKECGPHFVPLSDGPVVDK